MKDLENNIKLQVLTNDLQENFKKVVTDYWGLFWASTKVQEIHHPKLQRKA